MMILLKLEKKESEAEKKLRDAVANGEKCGIRTRNRLDYAVDMPTGRF